MPGFILFLAIAGQAGGSTSGDAAFGLLKTKCLACHDQKLHSGRLVMESRDALLKGGDHGAAIVPGRSGESLLIKRVTGEVAPRMPLEGELRPEEVDLLRRWIDAGAPAWAAARPDAPLSVPDVKPSSAVTPQVSAVAFSPDGRLLAVARYREIGLVDTSTRAAARSLPGASDVVRAVAFSPDGRTVAGAGGGAARYGEIVLWDAATGAVLGTLRGHADNVYAIAFSPDGRRLASSSYDRLVKLWDAASGQELRTLKEHTDAVFAVAFSPDGARLASGGADRTVKLWDVETGRRLYTLSDSTDVVTTLAFDPSGRRLTAGGADRCLRTWQLEADAGTLTRTIIAHEGEITRLAWFPDGRRVVSASADRTVKVWDMMAGEVARVLAPQPDWVLGLAVSPDGKVLAVGRYDGSIGWYDAADLSGPAAGARAGSAAASKNEER
jgi:WD40 repeat protein